MDGTSTTCVVIPTYNEKENIAPLVEGVEKAGVSGVSILFVDDSSPDGTGEEVRRVAGSKPWVRLLVRKGSRGFSSAYQEGFTYALKEIRPAILVGMDADLQHPASAIPALVDAVKGGADVAVASRYVPGGAIVGWSRGRRVISRGANAYARFLLRLPVKDATSGFKAMTSDAAAAVAGADLHSRRFEYQIATLKLLKGRKVVEVPYTFGRRSKGRSKFGFWDVPRFFFSVARMAL